MSTVKIMVEKLFARLDKNGDGIIEAYEVADEFRGKAIPEEVAVFMAQFDVNGDGKITKEEAYSTLSKFIPSI